MLLLCEVSEVTSEASDGCSPLPYAMLETDPVHYSVLAAVPFSLIHAEVVGVVILQDICEWCIVLLEYKEDKFILMMNE